MLLIRLFILFSLVSLTCSIRARENSGKIQLTLISPIPGEELYEPEVDLEGLLSDLSVEEIKVIVNDQKIQFVPVKKGYFQSKIHLGLRENLLVLYGANFDREYFRFEYKIVNASIREKTMEEKSPPSLSLNHLKPGEFKVLSPAEYETLQVLVKDNRKVMQVGYILDSKRPEYLEVIPASIPLNLPQPKGNSTSLEVFAIDSDGNRTSESYHFRKENLKCSLNIGPKWGIFQETDLNLRAKINGGKRPIKKHYRVYNPEGQAVEKVSDSEALRLRLKSFQVYSKLKASLLIEDSQGIQAICKAPETVYFYPLEHPRNFQLLKKSSLQSIEQTLRFSIEPPIRTGEMTVLLKWNDPVSGFSGQGFKVLGRKMLDQNDLRRFWEVKLRKRVPPGKYLMKLSMVLGNSDLTFTETMPVEVTRSLDDTQDLLQEILRDEDVD